MTDGQEDRRTDRPSYRDARTHLKIEDYLLFLTHAGETRFFLGEVWESCAILSQNEADVEVDTRNSKSNSISNEIMQNVLRWQNKKRYKCLYAHNF